VTDLADPAKAVVCIVEDVILSQLYEPADTAPANAIQPAPMISKPGGSLMRKLLLLFLVVPAVGFAEPLRVFASVVPIQTFVKAIGGEHVDARAMVRPGFNPHTYDPTPRQISALAGAVLYVRAAVPFENAWMERIRSANPGMEVLDARDGIALREMEAHWRGEEGHDQDRAADVQKDNHENHQAHDAQAVDRSQDHEQDPHVWTSPRLVKHMVGIVRDKLRELDPAHAAEFARNHDAFVTELDALDRDLHKLLDPLPNRRFLVFHPAWGYFADTYGLTQVPIEREGKQPGARALAALIEQAKREQVRVVFVQPQFDKSHARQVAKAIGGVVVAVDPLAADYVANLRHVGRELARALQP
jgi:zinc transport system substrate-binding protein